MLQFIQNPANIIILTLVILLVVLCVRSLLNDRKKGCSGCGKSCNACSSIACNLQAYREQQKANRKEVV